MEKTALPEALPGARAVSAGELGWVPLWTRVEKVLRGLIDTGNPDRGDYISWEEVWAIEEALRSRDGHRKACVYLGDQLRAVLGEMSTVSDALRAARREIDEIHAQVRCEVERHEGHAKRCRARAQEGRAGAPGGGQRMALEAVLAEERAHALRALADALGTPAP